MWVLIPTLLLLIISLYNTDFVEYKFVGLGNYYKVFSNVKNYQSIFNTIIYSIYIMMLTIFPSIIISLGFVYSSVKHNYFFRLLYNIPAISSGVIISNFWKWFFSVNGGFNYLLSIIGLKPLLWFGAGITAIPVISVIISMQNIGGVIIVLTSAILSVDKNTMEASKIDGCSDRQTRWFIVLPQIKSSVLTMCFLCFVQAWQMFETIFTVAPYEYSSSIMFRVYEVAFQNGKYGEGSALSVVLIGVVLSLTQLSKKLIK